MLYGMYLGEAEHRKITSYSIKSYSKADFFRCHFFFLISVVLEPDYRKRAMIFQIIFINTAEKKAKKRNAPPELSRRLSADAFIVIFFLFHS